MPPYRVYYSDGSFQDSENGHPDPRDVQVIVQKVDTEWIAFSGHDFYIWRDGQWIGVDLFGLFDWLQDTGWVMFGRTVGNKKYSEAMRLAMEERDRRNANG